MDIKKIIGIAAIAYFFWSKFNKKISTIEENLNNTRDNLDSYINEQEEEAAVAPAQKYLEITPKVTFSEITGNEWTGKVSWVVKNTSTDTTFSITRIKSNVIMNGHTSLLVAGNRDTITRIDPGKTVTINCTWQDKKWYNSSDVEAKDDLRDILRDNMGSAMPILECDVVIWVRGVAQVEETKYIFPRCRGTVTLEKGAKHYYTNQGEYAGNWE